jgi:ectoine hydroxylase-related dioxygenase (phytanoyl-CoA dioxygenase family)
MTTAPALKSFAEVGVFGIDQLDELEAFFRTTGFVVIRGLYNPETMAGLVTAGLEAQRGVATGKLSERHGTTHLVDDEDGVRTSQFPNYVTHVTEISPTIRQAVLDPRVVAAARRFIGQSAWLLEGAPFGVVYQDARPGRESSYSRIGWHSDWQSGPHLDRWPSVAFTIHLDGTSPANGFLRVVPGSHRWATPAPYENVNGVAVPDGSQPSGGYTDVPAPFPMPLGFEKVPGEIALYCEDGDLLLHDCYLWHSAARATEDEAVRRHIRGSFYSGDGSQHVTEDDFVKNAAR